ncbi:hypothetical protein ACX9R5_06565 [Rathayibacter sp. CAU 1779]
MTRRQVLGGGELAVILPGTWAVIPMDDDEAAAKAITALVKSRVGRADRLAQARRDVRSQLEGLVKQAKQADAFTFALSMEILPGVPFPASLLITHEAWPAGSAPAAAVRPTDAAEAGALEPVGRATPGTEPTEDAAGATDGTDGERLTSAFPDAEPLDLSFGRVVRTSVLKQTSYDEESAPELVLDYRLTAPDDDRLLRVHINAPMAYQPDLFLELFDAIVDSITFRQPVTVDDAGAADADV